MLLSAGDCQSIQRLLFLVQKTPSALSFPENLLVNVSDGRSLNAELWHFPEDIIIKLWEDKRQLFRPHSSFFYGCVVQWLMCILNLI